MTAYDLLIYLDTGAWDMPDGEEHYQNDSNSQGSMQSTRTTLALSAASNPRMTDDSHFRNESRRPECADERHDPGISSRSSKRAFCDPAGPDKGKTATLISLFQIYHQKGSSTYSPGPVNCKNNRVGDSWDDKAAGQSYDLLLPAGRFPRMPTPQARRTWVLNGFSSDYIAVLVRNKNIDSDELGRGRPTAAPQAASGAVPYPSLLARRLLWPSGRCLRALSFRWLYRHVSGICDTRLCLCASNPTGLEVIHSSPSTAGCHPNPVARRHSIPFHLSIDAPAIAI